MQPQFLAPGSDETPKTVQTVGIRRQGSQNHPRSRGSLAPSTWSCALLFGEPCRQPICNPHSFFPLSTPQLQSIKNRIYSSRTSTPVWRIEADDQPAPAMPTYQTHALLPLIEHFMMLQSQSWKIPALLSQTDCIALQDEIGRAHV